MQISDKDFEYVRIAESELREYTNLTGCDVTVWGILEDLVRRVRGIRVTTYDDQKGSNDDA